MSIPVRALLLTAAATGVFAAAIRGIKPAPERRPLPTVALEIDAENLDEAERDALVRELADQL